MDKRIVLLIFYVFSGVSIAIIALLGHARIASFILAILVILGAAFIYWLRKSSSSEQPVEQRKHRLFYWLGWVLLFGAVLKITIYSLQGHLQRTIGAKQLIEFGFELLLAFYLLLPARRDGNAKGGAGKEDV